MPSMLSSFICSRKQEDSCGLGVPALKRVGVAWVNQRSLMKIVGLNGRLDILFMNSNGDAHEHVLRPFYHFSMHLEKIGFFECLESKIIKAKIAIVDDG